VIIDFGANEGQNINYYLSKADIVVCVEPNPNLAKMIRKNFSKPIHSKKLFIENLAVIEDSSKTEIDFYIHKRKNQLSSVIEPRHKNNFFIVKVKAKSITEILEKYLTKKTLLYYTKFDLEGYDAIVISAMFKAGYFPLNLSTELSTPKNLEAIFHSGKYNGYKLHDNNTISEYLSLPVKTRNGITTTEFTAHSAGPMGEDIPSPWLTKRSIRNKLKIEGFGWKDIHATMPFNCDPVDLKHNELFMVGMKHVHRLMYRALLPYTIRNHPKFRKVSSVIRHLTKKP
jgi:FkbM family methyltransferase